VYINGFRFCCLILTGMRLFINDNLFYRRLSLPFYIKNIVVTVYGFVDNWQMLVDMFVDNIGYLSTKLIGNQNFIHK